MAPTIVTPAAPDRYAELTALSAEIYEDRPHNGLSRRDAAECALALLTDLDAFADAWDAWATAQRPAPQPQPLADSGELATAKRWAAAYCKASYHLAGGLDIRYDRSGAALVPSGTRGGIIHRVEGETCSCEAGQAGRPCWHRAAVDLVEQGKVAA